MDQKRLKQLENNMVQTALRSQQELRHDRVMLDTADHTPQQNEPPRFRDHVCSSSSSVYLSAEEDSSREEEADVVDATMRQEDVNSHRKRQPSTSEFSEEEEKESRTTWKESDCPKSNTLKEALRKTKSCGPSVDTPTPGGMNNQRVSPCTSKGSKSSLLEAIPGAEINQLQTPRNPRKISILSSTSEADNVEFISLDPDFGAISATELQKVFDWFKSSSLSTLDCQRLLGQLSLAQNRNDFQWALHQLGGVNVLLFLYARIVEICEQDDVQAKALSLVLGQLKHHTKVTDVPSSSYNLIRFVLNNSRSAFGFKTLLTLIHYSLTPSGNKLVDYHLLDSCLLSSWRKLIRVRCTDAEAPTGRRCLFECLLTVMLDLLLEKNPHRSTNIAMLKNSNFPVKLLAICCGIISECNQQKSAKNYEEELFLKEDEEPSTSSRMHLAHSSSLGLVPLSSMDALRICALVKSIFSELMAPVDADVAVAIVRYGLHFLVPKELPPVPEREQAYFVYHQKVDEGTEAEEIENTGSNNSLHDATPPRSPNSHTRLSRPFSFPGRTTSHETLDDVVLMNQDIPEIVVKSSGLNTQKEYEKESFEQSQNDKFRDTFQESLSEALMAVLLNALVILPDGAFFSKVRPHLNSHLFVTYCSHPSISIKNLGIKLLTSYLSRVRNPCITEFLKSKGFILSSLFIKEEKHLAQTVVNVCQGMGPISYPLALGLLDTTEVLGAMYHWIQEDEATTIPALMSMGLIPTILNLFQNSMPNLPRPLTNIMFQVISYHVLHPKEEPWRVLFCPALESAPAGSPLTGKFYQEAVMILKNYRGTNLQKNIANQRLMWLLERATASRFGQDFDKWMFEIFTMHIMELDFMDDVTSEGWKYFVKRNKKRLTYLMGIFLSRLFVPSKVDFETKQQCLETLLQNCPHISIWLPKVLKSDMAIERCFTSFLRIFLHEASRKDGQKNTEEEENRKRSSSYQSLLAEGNRLSMQLNPGGYMVDDRRPSTSFDCANDILPKREEPPRTVKEAARKIRERFENILVDAGVIAPTYNVSTFSADFRKFKILFETPPIYGICYQELRQCLKLLEKLRSSITPSFSPTTTPLGENEIIARSPINKTHFCNAPYFNKIFDTTAKFALKIVESITQMKTEMEVEAMKVICTGESNLTAKRKWKSLTEQLGHPRAVWHFENLYPKFWALDQSEGPGRVRTRLYRQHVGVAPRFILPKYRNQDPQIRAVLDYLFTSEKDDKDTTTNTDEDFAVFPSISHSEIQSMNQCTRIIPGEEISGELILNNDTLYFIPETHSLHQGSETLELCLASVANILRRRCTHEERAVEIFMGGKSYFFAFKNKEERELFMRKVGSKLTVQTKNKDVLMESSLTTMTNRWLKGQLSNFDYLMYLNTAAGRTYCDLMQYPVFPFVLSKYEAPFLDLHAPLSYRDLRKPMAIQNPNKEEHYLQTYNYLKRECDSKPFHYGSHYSNSGIVLHFLVRLPPYTQHLLKYQDGNFDIPDRSFHSMDTTWRLAAKDSHTDYKEAIPEFYYLPDFLMNLQQFDFGVRQCGTRVGDVELPDWAKGNARLFTLINRQALESNYVRKMLCDWIDLIFGFKQTGKAAVMAVNVFHPSTYEGFDVDNVDDELVKRARRAMVATYGQTPKQLFTATHPRSTSMTVENCAVEVIDTVSGLKWGYFLGSPTCSELEVVNTRQYADDMALFETSTRIVFWPRRTIIIGDKVVGIWTSSKVHVKSKLIHLCVGDEITTCNTTHDSIWIGHHSGKITVIRLSQNLEKVLEKIELVGHYKPIKCIELNQEFATAVSCSGEDYAIIWDMHRVAYLNLIQIPTSIDAVHSSRTTGDIVITSLSSNTVTLTTINGFEIGTVQPEEKIESACLSSMDPGRNVNLIAVGCDYGYIKFYSTWDLKFVNEIKVVQLATLAIQNIRYSRDGRRLYCLSTNEEASISAALQLPDSPR